MLGDIFISVLNMSFVSSFVILFVILARYLLKKVPKIYSYSLWSFVLFRLVCPDSFLSTLSIIPINSKPISPDIIYSQAPSINTGITALDNSVSAVLPTATPYATPYASMNPMQGLMYIGVFIWLIGIAALIIYSIVSLVMLKSQLKGTHYKEDIYFCDGIKTPFVIGIFRPKIYLPSQIKESELEYVVLHERTHIRRLDHVIKIAAFLVLCVHWFNPLAVGFDIGKSGEYILSKYRAPRDGENYEADAAEIFPEELSENVLDISVYSDGLKQQITNMLIADGYVDSESAELAQPVSSSDNVQAMQDKIENLEAEQKEYMEKIQMAKEAYKSDGTVDFEAQSKAESEYLKEKAKNAEEIAKIEKELDEAIKNAAKNGDDAGGENGLE